MFRYKAKKHKVFPRNKTGREGERLIEVEGPENDGVLLRVHVQKKGEVNQAVVPQVLRQHHWMTFLDVHPVSGTDRQIYIALAYGEESDKDLVKKIKAVLAVVEKPARS